MLALGIRYLTGYAVSTDIADRARAEWPPHPARVFMALAAAHFETGKDPDERATLEWLEAQSQPPVIFAGEAYPRDVVTSYVPVNDMVVPGNAATLKVSAVRSAMTIVPQYRSNKQLRTFPRVRVRHDDNGEPTPVFLIWPDASPDANTRNALEQICDKVIRIGHSSSLVQMWVEDQPPVANMEPDEMGQWRMRIASRGTLAMLAATYNHGSIEEWVDLKDQIVRAKGKAKTALKAELVERFGNREPRSLRPTISRWQGYRRAIGDNENPPCSGAFDRHLLVLSIDEGPVIGLDSTWQLLTAMHKTILAHCDPAPEWLSGHQQDGSPSQKPHLAMLPLAFVGREHADGHLLGIGLAFPKEIGSKDRGRSLRGLLYADDGARKPISLRLGTLGTWTLTREMRPSPPITLSVETWTDSSNTWGTVTPIVLDRHPKVERGKDRERWTFEVADIIAESCERQGLPRPVGVDIDKTSWFQGAPRAVAGKGSGFPLMPVKIGSPQRQQVHAWLHFDQPVEGPLLLGAGRYRGYGLCRPWKERA